MTKNEVAQQAGVSLNTVDRWILNGLFQDKGKRVKLNVEKRGQRVYIDQKEFARFMELRASLN